MKGTVCRTLFWILIAEVIIISILALIYAIFISMKLTDLHILAIQDCLRQNVVANETICLV